MYRFQLNDLVCRRRGIHPSTRAGLHGIFSIGLRSLHSVASIADTLDLSSTVLGITVLSFATTLPEKFIAVIGGARRHGGILVASTTGTSIFLLILRLGITLVVANQNELAPPSGEQFW